MVEKRGSIFISILLFSFIILSLNFVSSATINVPGDFSTIQGAINNASDGDVVNVSAGTYFENQILIDKEISVVGQGGDITIIDGGNALISSEGLVRINASGDVTFEGFKLQNAGGPDNGGDGADDKDNIGIFAKSNSITSDYTIKNNKIYGTNNSDDEQDFGIYSFDSKAHLIIENNMIRNTGSNPIVLEIHSGLADIIFNDLDTGIYGVDSVIALTYGGTDVTNKYNISYNNFNLNSGMFDHYAAAVVIASAFEGEEGKFTNVKINNNVINNIIQNRSGIVLWNGDSSDGSEGEITADLINNILNGQNQEDSIGIAILGKTTDVNIQKNKILNLWKGIISTEGTNGTHYSSNTLINYNDLIDNNFSLIWDGSTTLDAENNFWGKCSGPSGNDITGNGSEDVDYQPFLGICISQKIDDVCAVEKKNSTVYAYLNGSNIESAWISYLVNSTSYNKTFSSNVNNNFSFVILGSKLIGGQNLTWNAHANDSTGRIYSNGLRSFYVRNSTRLSVSPSVPNGLNNWYITEPEFTLIKDNFGSDVYYQWDSDDVNLYISPFGLENTPNPSKDSAGTLELNWWTNFMSCGNESKNAQVFYVDLTDPEVKNLQPAEDSIVNNSRPLISALLDEVYQSNSGIDIESVVFTLNEEVINFTNTPSGDLDYIVSHTPSEDLPLGKNNVTISVRDNSGRDTIFSWSFTVGLPSNITVQVYSPVSDNFGSKRVAFNLTTSENAKLIEYINWNDNIPRFRRLCDDCNEYGFTREKMKTLHEGENNLTFRATSYLNTIFEENVSVFVDSKVPRIHKTLPSRNKYTNGSSFYVRYTEDNLREISVSFNPTINATSCNEVGRNSECFVDLNLTDYDGLEIDYYFNLTDVIRSVQSRMVRVFVDTTKPNITYFNYSIDERNVNFMLNVSEINFDRISYIDYSEEDVARPKTLCSRLNEGFCDKTKSFSFGSHNLSIEVLDKAGNSYLINNVSFEIV